MEHNKLKSISFLNDKVEKCLASWQNSMLSPAGKFTLVKSVLNSAPLCTMSSNLVPTSVCQKLDALAKKFLGKPSLVSWDVVCKPKSLGGLGVGKFKVVTEALLGKLGWYLAIGLDRLWVCAIKAKYFLMFVLGKLVVGITVLGFGKALCVSNLSFLRVLVIAWEMVVLLMFGKICGSLGAQLLDQSRTLMLMCINLLLGLPCY